MIELKMGIRIRIRTALATFNEMHHYPHYLHTVYWWWYHLPEHCLAQSWSLQQSDHSYCSLEMSILNLVDQTAPRILEEEASWMRHSTPPSHPSQTPLQTLLLPCPASDSLQSSSLISSLTEQQWMDQVFSITSSISPRYISMSSWSDSPGSCLAYSACRGWRLCRERRRWQQQTWGWLEHQKLEDNMNPHQDMQLLDRYCKSCLKWIFFDEPDLSCGVIIIERKLPRLTAQ